jgi:hypothetical protein
MKKSTALFLLIAFWITLSPAFAQKKRRVSPTSKYSMASAYYAQKKYFSVGGSLNAVNYFGDIAPSSSIISTDIRFTRPNFSIFVMRRMTPRVSWKASLMWSRLQGDDFNASTSDPNDKFRFVRNLHFRNDIKELDFAFVFDLYENRQTFLKRPNLVPYAMIGLGVMAHNPIAKTSVDAVTGNGGEWISLQPLGTEGQGREGYGSKYSLIQIVIPAGLGLRYKVNSRIDVSLEWSIRYTFTDYLDDVSGKYADPNDLGGPNSLAYRMSYRIEEPIAAYANESREAGMREFLLEDNPSVFPFGPRNGYGQKGDQRGKPSEKDWYMITGVHVSYIIPPTGRKSRFR